MADLITLLNQLSADGAFAAIASNQLAQFGTPVRRYVGSEILPERLTNENMYREDLIRYRTVIANDAPRFSPAQKKGGVDLVGSMTVELGTQDIAVEMTGREFDFLMQQAVRGEIEDVVARINRWVDLKVNLALIEKSEVQRFQALVNAQVVRSGANGFSEVVDYPNPAGHRVAAGGDWTSDAYNPLDDIIAMHQLLASKGYQTSRIITSTDVVATLARNQKVAEQNVSLSFMQGGLAQMQGFGSVSAVNSLLQSNGLPILETYDTTYRVEGQTFARFLPAGTMLFVAQGGLDPETFQFEDETRVVSNPLGYTAVGRAAGQPAPGRVVLPPRLFTNKPPRLEAEGYQESLPVITEPEAIAVIHTIETS